MFVITKQTMEKQEKPVFLNMLGNQFMSNINMHEMFKCLYLCEKPPWQFNMDNVKCQLLQYYSFHSAVQQEIDLL